MKRTSRTVACLPCRAAKQRCDGSQPCERCVSHNSAERCVYAAHRRGGVRLTATEAPSLVTKDSATDFSGTGSWELSNCCCSSFGTSSPRLVVAERPVPDCVFAWTHPVAGLTESGHQTATHTLIQCGTFSQARHVGVDGGRSPTVYIWEFWNPKLFLHLDADTLAAEMNNSDEPINE